MQKLSALVCLGLLAWAGIGHAAEQRDVAAFSAININGSYQTTLTAGQPQSIAINAKGDLSQIITEVKDNTLYIYSKNSTANTTPVILEIKMPKLQNLTLAGNNKFSANALAEKELVVSTSGNNQVTLAGSTHTFATNLQGTTDLDAKNLAAKVITLKAEGTAQIAVRTKNELNIKADGNVVVKMYGTPHILNTSLTGNSKLQVAN